MKKKLYINIKSVYNDTLSFEASLGQKLSKMVDLKILSPFKGTKYQNINKYDSFHRAIMPILILNQTFGLIPVIGVTEGDVRHVRYKIKSFRFAYSVFTLLCISLESVSSLVTMGEIRLNNVGKRGWSKI